LKIRFRKEEEKKVFGRITTSDEINRTLKERGVGI